MNCKRTGGLLIFALLITVQLFAQQQVNPYADRWTKGRIMLTDGDTLKSVINYNPGNDLLQANQSSTIKTFSPQKVLSFDFWDNEYNRVRYYTALPYSASGSYKPLLFFETLYDGPHLALLGRENLVIESATPMYDPYMYRPMHRQGFGQRTRINTQYFFMDRKSGKIRQYKPSRKELLSLLKDKQGPVKEYIKQNKLRYNDTGDLIRVIEYYNELKTGK